VLAGGAPVKGPGTDRILLFQELGLFPWLTAGENVAFGLKMAGMPKKERRERAAEYLRMVHLGKFQNAHVHELSGGMKQRVALARSLALQPKILLMDEPFAALDAQTREFMQAELLKIWSQARKTVLFITHQINEAVYLADRVVVMSARPGKVKAVFQIPFARPRTLSLKRDPQFLEIEDKIWQLVEERPERIGMVLTPN
jgi:NitT/TauT family transport system ATP-binding protein